MTVLVNMTSLKKAIILRYIYLTIVVWYLTDQVKSNHVLNKHETMTLCSVKIWMTVDKPRTAEVDRSLNYSMEEA